MHRTPEQDGSAADLASAARTQDPARGSSLDAAPRLLLGVGLLSLVLILLAIPLLIAARGARRARGARVDGSARKAPSVDAWTESARRMEGPA